MAPGYVVAIVLEASGLLAFALGAALMHAERRAKSLGLRRFLTSGQATETTIAPAAVSRPRRDPPATRPQMSRSPQSGTASEAALALRNAYAAPVR